MIMSGAGAYGKMEIYDPTSNTSCPGPAIPGMRVYFSADQTDAGPLVCGGQLTATSCHRLAADSEGEWKWSHYSRISARASHVSWTSPAGQLLLIGGQSKRNAFDFTHLTSTAVVGETEQPGPFQLRKKTKCACLIDLGASFLLTGGSTKWGASQPRLNTVEEYSAGGLVRRWPKLRQKRHNHACGRLNQFYIVAGGHDGVGFGAALDSTELLRSPTGVWETVAALPFKASGPRISVTTSGLYLTGGNDANDQKRREILRWEEEAEEWRQVGQMLHGRQAHAVLVIPDTLRNLYCNKN